MADPIDRSELNGLELLLIEQACAKLVVHYTHWVDFGQAERVADLFAPDGVWEVGETRFEGREAVRRMFRSRQAMSGRRSRHVCTNLAVDVVDSEHATGLVYLSLYRHDFPAPGSPGSSDSPEAERGPAPGGPPVAVGQYRDRFVRTREGWRFARRTTELAFGDL